MTSNRMLDTDDNPLTIGALYCIVTNYGKPTDYGDLVRFCGYVPESDQPLFADANTWEEHSIDGYGVLLQIAPVIDPTTQGWPPLSS